MGKETSVQHSISGDRSGPVLMKPSASRAMQPLVNGCSERHRSDEHVTDLVLVILSHFACFAPNGLEVIAQISVLNRNTIVAISSLLRIR